MSPGPIRRLLARYRRGAAESLGRDEFDPNVTSDTLVFVLGSFVAVILAIIGAAAVARASSSTTASEYLIMVLPVVVFVGVVVSTWEVLRLRRTRASDDAVPGTRSGLDVWFTVVSILLGVVALVLTLYVIDWLT